MIALMRAFVSDDGTGGNAALVVREQPDDAWADRTRLRLAVEGGVPATVFVAPDEHRVRIVGGYGLPIGFGGHPTLAAVEALHRWGADVTSLQADAGEIRTRRDPDSRMIRVAAPAAWSKPWRHLQMDAPATIDALSQLPDGEDFTQVWAWIDEPAGVVRARLWAPRIDKGEDEACGSASMILADRLQRSLTVIHGRGRNRIEVTPLGDGLVEVGGRCVSDPVPPDLSALVARLRHHHDEE